MIVAWGVQTSWNRPPQGPVATQQGAWHQRIDDNPLTAQIPGFSHRKIRLGPTFHTVWNGFTTVALTALACKIAPICLIPYIGHTSSTVGYSGFNPRPRTGGDVEDLEIFFRDKSFNPRPRTGGDRIVTDTYLREYRFNPRPRTGGDSANHACSQAWHMFQSAPPHGGRRPGRIETLISRSGFNPRPRTGGDPGLDFRLATLERFNPRPRTGGDA